jgi:hypothetical protein
MVPHAPFTIRLPTAIVADKADRIVNKLKRVLKISRVPIQCYQSLVGKLRHAANILPAILSLFTPLNNALKHEPSFIGLGTTIEVRSAFPDFIMLKHDLDSRPKHVSELVARPGSNIGYADASAAGTSTAAPR